LTFLWSNQLRIKARLYLFFIQQPIYLLFNRTERHFLRIFPVRLQRFRDVF